MRILHTADWQIGKGFGRFSGDVGALLREQRYTAVQHLAELAVAHGVDAVLVAGDVFDSQTLADTALRRTLDAMAAWSGPWVLLPGNHDAALAESVWTRIERLGCCPDNIHLALSPEPILLAEDRLAVLPAPLRRRHEPADLTEWFNGAETPADAVRVGLAHGSLLNRLPEGAVRHNPIAENRVHQARLDYLALGDWHGTLEIAERSWYAGTPETDSFRSRAPGHALLVDFAGGSPRVSVLDTGCFQWHEINRTLAGEADLAALDDHFAGLGKPFDRHIVRLELAGSLGLAVRARLDDLLARWHARFAHLEWDDSALQPQASEADLAVFAGSGFVTAALAELRNRQAAGEPYAGDAVQRLYAAYQRLREC